MAEQIDIDNEADEKRSTELHYLEILKKPPTFKFSKGNTRRYEQVLKGRALWERVLLITKKMRMKASIDGERAAKRYLEEDASIDDLLDEEEDGKEEEVEDGDDEEEEYWVEHEFARRGENPPPEPVTQRNSLEFLDLPAEVRNRIYEFYFQINRDELEPLCLTGKDTGDSSQEDKDFSWCKRCERYGGEGCKVDSVQELVDQMLVLPAISAGRLCLVARNRYRQYKEEYRGAFGLATPHMHFHRCSCENEPFHNDDEEEDVDDEDDEDDIEDVDDEETQSDTSSSLTSEHAEKANTHDRTPTFVDVNEGGRVCVGPPPLCIANTQIFRETWGLYLGGRTRFRVDILNFNFRPLFRLCRLLQKAGIQSLTARQVHLHFCFRQELYTERGCPPGHKPGLRCAGMCTWTYLRTFIDFEHLKELFAKHWFEGFPLWYPTEDQDTIAENKKPRRFSWRVIIYPSETSSGDEAAESPQKGLIESWMYFVRQATALWRIDRPSFNSLTDRFVSIFVKEYGEEREARCLFELRGPELVENALWMIGEGLECRLGYHGRWTDKSQFYDNERYLYAYSDTRGNLTEQKIRASAREYKLYDIVQQYRAAINQALRKALGGSYADWEGLAVDATVPLEGII